MSGYKGHLGDGREVYIPHWPVDVSLENLTKAGRILGAANVINIAAPDIPTVVIAIMNAENSEAAAQIVRHFVCCARVDGKKIDKIMYDTMFEGNLADAAELFALVVHAQYHSFFKLGLVRDDSQPS